MQLTPTQLRTLAREGAIVRLSKITEERNGLLQLFPDLREPRETIVLDTPAPVVAAPASPSPLQKRRRMNKAQREAVSRRMKAYWAAQRASKH